MSRSIKVDQISDAIITAPGIRIAISDGQPVNTISIGATDTKIMPEDEASMSFEVPFSGLYRIMFGCQFNAVSATTGQIKLVFDEAGTPIVVGYDDEWQIRVITNFDSSVWFGEVELSAGTHTVTAYAKEINGTGLQVLGSSSNPVQAPRLELVAVSGSGAGGNLAPNKFIQSADRTITATSLSPVPTEPMSVTFESTQDETVRVGLHVQGASGTGANTVYLQLRLDGTLIGNVLSEVLPNTTYQGPLNDSFSVQVDAGSHTLELYAATFTSQSWSIKAGSWIDVDQNRGGLVPIRHDGVNIIDKPAAVNYVGPNVSVTNVGGTANVEFNGVAGGVEVSSAALSSDQTGLSASAWNIITGLSHTVTIIEGERLALTYSVIISSSSTATRTLAYRVNSGSWVPLEGASAVSGYWTPLSGVVELDLSSGSNTIDLGEYHDAGSGTVFGATTFGGLSFTSRSAIRQIRGGYVHPENTPVFARDSSDTSLINATAAIGADSEMRLLFNDGVRRKASLPLTCDIDTDGIGGRDTGDATAESAGDLYHLFAVESDTDVTRAKLVLSKDAVPGTSGPPSFSVYRYLWTVRVTSTGPVVLEEFLMTEGGWYEPLAKDLTAYTLDSGDSAVPGTVGSWVDKTTALRALMPESADEIDVHGIVSSTNQQLWLAAEAAPSWTAASAQPYTQRFATNSSYSAARRMACPARELAVQFGQSVSSTWTIQLAGYRNALYPGANEARAQAPYLPDTKPFKGIWQTVTTVDFLAYSGQPSTVKLTLQDGKQRTVIGTLNWAVATGIADLGYDEAGSQGNSKWLYWYAVPSSGDDNILSIRASDNPPSTGPAGYSNFEYLWADYIDGSGNLAKVFQSGQQFSYATQSQPTGGFTGGGSADVSIQTLSLVDHIPATASYAILQAYIQVNSASTSYFFVNGEGDSSSGTTLWNTSTFRLGGNAGGEAAHSRGLIATPTTTKQVDYFREAAFSEYRVDCHGWIDEWIKS